MRALGLAGATLCATSTATAKPELPSYSDALIERTWGQLNQRLEQLCQFDPTAQAVACTQDPQPLLEHVRSFQKHVVEDASLTYLLGLGERYRGQEALARRHYLRALELDPLHTGAWHDLGELYLIAGQFDRAHEAFEQVSKLHATGEACWIGPWRLAEIAAHRSDPSEFESQMKEAIRRGFSFRQIDGLPNWKRFYLNPDLRRVIDKMIRVYGTRETLESLQP